MAFTRRTFITGSDTSGTPATTQASANYSQAAGDLIVVCVKWEGTNGTCTGVTDVAGNAYTPCTRANNSSNQENSQLFYCLSSLASGVNVVTATFSSAATYRDVYVQPYLPGGTVSFVAEATATGSSNSPLTGSFAAGTVAVAAISEFLGTLVSSSNAGWTTQLDNNGNGAHSQDRIDNPGGNISAGCTLSSSADWQIVAASFTDSGVTTTLFGQALT